MKKGFRNSLIDSSVCYKYLVLLLYRRPEDYNCCTWNSTHHLLLLWQKLRTTTRIWFVFVFPAIFWGRLLVRLRFMMRHQDAGPLPGLSLQLSVSYKREKWSMLYLEYLYVVMMLPFPLEWKIPAGKRIDLT